MYEAHLAAVAFSTCVMVPASHAGAAQTAANAPPSAVTIHVENFKFEPASVTVHVGDRVSFINDDDEAHTVTANDKSFDSEGLDGGQTWQHVFSKPGSHAYYCEMHPYMKAEIVVVAAAVATPRRTDSLALNPFALRLAELRTFMGVGQSPIDAGKSK